MGSAVKLGCCFLEGHCPKHTIPGRAVSRQTHTTTTSPCPPCTPPTPTPTPPFPFLSNTQVIGDDSYLDGDFISTVQQRGAAIIKVWGILCLVCVGVGALKVSAGRVGGLERCSHGMHAGMRPRQKCSAAEAFLTLRSRWPLTCLAHPATPSHTCTTTPATHPCRPPPLPPSLQARGLSSALSAASSACDHVRDWVLGTPGGWVLGWWVLGGCCLLWVLVWLFWVGAGCCGCWVLVVVGAGLNDVFCCSLLCCCRAAAVLM